MRKYKVEVDEKYIIYLVEELGKIIQGSSHWAQELGRFVIVMNKFVELMHIEETVDDK